MDKVVTVGCPLFSITLGNQPCGESISWQSKTQWLATADICLLVRQMQYNWWLHSTKLSHLTYDQLVSFVQPHSMCLGDFIWNRWRRKLSYEWIASDHSTDCRYAWSTYKKTLWLVYGWVAPSVILSAWTMIVDSLDHGNRKSKDIFFHLVPGLYCATSTFHGLRDVGDASQCCHLWLISYELMNFSNTLLVNDY